MRKISKGTLVVVYGEMFCFLGVGVVYLRV